MLIRITTHLAILSGLIALLVSPPAVAQQSGEAPCVNWTPRTLPPVSGHVMAFDSHRNRLVVVGVNGICGQTWEWDGLEWMLVSATSSDLANFRGMAYDEVRQRVVLLGGGAGGQTFEWDGLNWVQRNVCCNLPPDSGPVAMTFDASRGRVVLLAGSSIGGSLLKLYSWSGSGWDPISEGLGVFPYAGGPLALAYDASRATLVAVARWGNVIGTYELTFQGWSLVANSVPPERTVGSIAYDPTRQRVVLHAGRSDAQVFADTWEWDGIQWTERIVPNALPRYGHVLVTDSIRNRVLALGSEGAARDPRLWALDPNGWRSLSGDVPIPSAGQAAYFPPLDQTVFYHDETGKTWLWGAAGWTEMPATGPGVRGGYGMAYDEARQRIVLYGGYSRTTGLQLGDTWEFDGVNWFQIDTPGLGQRELHALAFDQGIGRVVLFGGMSGCCDEQVTYGDLWAWDGTEWTLIRNDPSLARYGHSMTYDEVGQRLVVAGGSLNTLPSLYLAPNGWMVINGPGESGMRIAFDSIRQRVVMTGIGPGPNYGDLWELEGEQWQRRSTSSRPCPSVVFLAYDTSRERLIRFSDSVWEIGSRGVLFSSQPISQATQPGSLIEFSVVSEGTPDLAYQWRHNGVPIPGESQPSLQLQGVSVCDSGLYDCVVSNCCSVGYSAAGLLRVMPDINGDGTINTADLTVLLGGFGKPASPLTGGDVSGDGQVNTLDLTIILGSFGLHCGG